MDITFAPNGILQINNCRIIYRNFAGEASKFNREGDRNFAVVIPSEDDANELISKDWKVKIKPPRDEDEGPFMYLPVKVKFNGRGPNVYLQSGNRTNRLDEEDIDILDDIDISSVDLDVRPYDWEVNGKTGRTAYLYAMKIIQNVDRFADDYPHE